MHVVQLTQERERDPRERSEVDTQKAKVKKKQRTIALVEKDKASAHVESPPLSRACDDPTVINIFVGRS